MRRCVNKDARPRRGWIWGVPHRFKKGTSASENETPFIRVWKLLPSRRGLKTLRGSPKKTISPSVDLGHYNGIR